MRSRAIPRNQIGGWGFSLILHGILLSAIWPFFHQLPAPMHQEPFQWDVTFIELPQQAAVVDPPSNDNSTNELPTGEFDDSIHTSINGRPKITAPAPPTPFITKQMPVIQDVLPLQRDATDYPQTKVATTPVTTEPSAPIAASIEREIPPSPAPSVSDVAMAPPQSRETEQTALSSALPAASNQPSAARADYSWLQRAVSRRLEELKRSSRPSLDDSSPLKVLVKAVVSNTGELMEAEVVKSSGMNRIDQEAMTLVERAFPMPLDQTLDRQQVVLRIPITYSRD
jgi:periplasmic protein TonB